MKTEKNKKQTKLKGKRRKPDKEMTLAFTYLNFFRERYIGPTPSVQILFRLKDKKCRVFEDIFFWDVEE